MKKQLKGGITIYYAIVFTVLVAFCATIVDVSRQHMAVYQSQRALQVASQSLLASYDTQLLEQYGLFGCELGGREEVTNALSYYVNSSLNPDYSLAEMSLLEQTFYDDSNYFHLYDYSIDEYSIRNEKSINDADYIKLQILEFMKYRAPISAVQPFLDKVESFHKAAKTGEIIHEKDKVVSKLDDLSDLYIDLQENIDGIVISKSNGKYKTAFGGRPQLAQKYIKKIYVADDYDNPIYSHDKIPDSVLVDELNQNVVMADWKMAAYKTSLNLLKWKMREIIRLYTDLREKQGEIDKKKEEQDDIEEPDSSSEDYEDELKRYQKRERKYEAAIRKLKKEKKKIEKKIKEAVDLYNTQYDEMYECVSLFQELVIKKYDETYYKTYYGTIEDSLQVIDRITTLSKELEEELDVLKGKLENKEAIYIQGVCDSIAVEVEKYERALGLKGTYETSPINNIAEMKVGLEHNQSVLKAAESDIYKMYPLYSEINKSILESQLKSMDTEVADEIRNATIIDIDFGDSYKTNIHKEISNNLKDIEAILDGYTREFEFDYRGIKRDTGGFDFNMFIQQKKEEYELDLGFVDSFVTCISDEYLPSDIKGKSSNSVDEKEDSKDVQKNLINDNKERMGKFYAMFEALENMGKGLRDEVYVNEYVMGMFAAATDHDLLGEGIGGANALTLTGYEKGKHYMNNEIEYILFGQKYDGKNLMMAIGMIFAIRIALNIIHIVADREKMVRINNMANAVAGWWSLGVGGAILTVIITVIWAMLESVYDIKVLLKGDTLPLVKLKGDWKTDVFAGLSKEMVEIVMEEVEEEVTEGSEALKLNEKGLMPSLSYKDYLRLLLLSQIVDEESKMYRILDLIQLNMAKEREETVVLNDYVYSFESCLEGEINNFFLNGDYVIDNIINRIKGMRFDAVSKVSY